MIHMQNNKLAHPDEYIYPLCKCSEGDSQGGQMFLLLGAIQISVDYVYYNRTVFISDGRDWSSQ